MKRNGILLSLILCVFGITTGEFVISGILQDIANDFIVSIPAAGLLVSAYAIGMIIGGPVLTALTAHFARKPLLMILLIAVVMGNIASALAPTYAVLFVSRILTSLVTSTFFANAIVIAASTASPDKQASTIAKLAFGMNLSIILGAPIGTLIGNTFGWRSTFYAIAACCMIGLLLVSWIVPTSQRSPSGTSAMRELQVFRNKDVLLAIAITIVGNAGLLIVFTYFSPLLTNVTGFTSETVALLLLVYGLGATLGNFVGGWLSDRALMLSQISILAILAATLVLLWLVSTHMIITAILIFVIGALGFAVIPGMQTRVLTTATAAPTLAIAVNASAYQLAAAFAAWLGGQAINAGLEFRSIYLVSATVTVAGILVSGYVWLRDHKISHAHNSTSSCIDVDAKV